MKEKVIVRSPGRINLIGEHTDYNLGFVLPAAIDRHLEFTIIPSDSNLIVVKAVDLSDTAFIDRKRPVKSEKDWVNYCAGIIDQLNKKGFEVGAFKCSFGGDIPIGAGMASSAALSCGFLTAINEFFDFGIEKIEIARMAQKSENEFVGVNCGIMDQYACVFGKKDNFIKIDCRAQEHEFVETDLKGFSLVLIDTGIKHALADSEYNMRRKECEKGATAMQQNTVEVKSLRDATLVDLALVRNAISQDVFDRCEYVINENDRVLAAQKAISNRDFELLGSLMFRSHYGLKNKYKVSCKELDILVEFAKNHPDVLGSRMMGGGFGGCTINLVNSRGLERFKSEVTEHYLTRTGIEGSIYDIKLSDGASVI